MSRRSLILTVVAVAFGGVLLYTTLRSTQTPLGQSADDRSAVQETCRQAIVHQHPDAEFPFDANVAEAGAGRLRLTGVVDTKETEQTVRRNYDCLISPDSAGGFVTDSVTVWQSH